MVSALIDLMGAFFQAGDFAQMEALARAMLKAIPDDLVALQFLGLAMAHMGREQDVHRLLARADDALDGLPQNLPPSAILETAGSASYRLATAEGAMLRPGWRQIADLARAHGFSRLAERAGRLAPGLNAEAAVADSPSRSPSGRP